MLQLRVVWSVGWKLRSWNFDLFNLRWQVGQVAVARTPCDECHMGMLLTSNNSYLLTPATKPSMFTSSVGLIESHMYSCLIGEVSVFLILVSVYSCLKN